MRIPGLKNRPLFHALIFGLALAVYPLAQGMMDETQILEAIRSGHLPLTDEFIEGQKQSRPELKGLTNQQIRDRLQRKAKAAEESEKKDGEAPPTDLQQKNPPHLPKNMSGNQAGSKDSTSKSRFPPELQRFGYDFFSNNPNHNASGSGVPALPEYILSPGDEIQVYTWGRENQSQTVPIDNEGMFHLPPLRPVRLAGMKFADAQKLITQELEKINGVKASVGLGKLKSIRIFVLGEAINPGSYVVPAGATVTTALFLSGGIRDIGSLRAIQLKRNGRIIANLDLYDMLLKGNNQTDAQLLTGDVIFVPVAPIQVAVTGMVKRPGIYEVKAGSKVLQAIELAGGLSSNAFRGRVRLDRIENHKRKIVLDVGMEKMAGNSNATISDGDILTVEEVLSRIHDAVYLEGNVNRPGHFEYKKDMTIKDLIPSSKDLKSETFFSYGHIKRSADDDERTLLIPFSLKDVFEKNASVPLMPRDTVIIYSKFQIMDQPVVKISGTVRRPGSYPFMDKMRISDLILAGGGLTIETYLPEAHLIRVLRIQESDSLYSTLMKVNLTSLIDNPADENNLELKPHDSLLIFPRENFVLSKWVSINGSVKKEGAFELTQNMGVPELLSQANGITRATYKTTVEVVRKTIERDSVVKRQIYRLSLPDLLSGREKFALQDGDAVYVRELAEYKGNIVVTLSGEFNFPGQYEVAKGEKLSSVILRAGGFTGTAYLRGAVFTRKRVREQQLQTIEEVNSRLEQQTQNLLAQTTNEKDRANILVSIEQQRLLLSKAREARYLGRVVVTLDRELDFAGGEDDIALESGDELRIDPSPSTVTILGEVFTPTSVIFGSRSNTVSECVAVAGGITEYGDEDNIYYVKPDGSVLTPKNTSFFGMRGVEAGGAIIVPPKGPKRDYLDALAKITQIVYQIAISVGVAQTLF